MGLSAAAYMVISAVVAAGSAAYSGYQAKQQADAQEEMANEQARLAEQQANQQADLARKDGASEAQQARDKGKRLLASQRAALAGSGVKIDEGTGDTLQQETQRLSEQDALGAVRDAGTRYKLLREGGSADAKLSRMQAKNYGRQGRAAVVSGTLNTGAAATRGMSRIPSVRNTNTTTNMTTQRTSGQKYSLLNGRYSLNG